MIILKLIVSVLIFVAAQGYERKGYPGYEYQDDLDGWMKLHKKPATWQKASDTCTQEGAFLVTARFNELDEKLIEFLKDKDTPYVYVASKALSAPKKPEDEIPNETVQLTKPPITKCVVVLAHNASKIKVDCNEEYPFICYAPKPEDEDCDLTKWGQDRKGWPGYHRCKDIDGYVKIHPESVDFDKAKETCESEGGSILDLTIPKNKELALKMLKVNNTNNDLAIRGKFRITHPNGGLRIVEGKKKYVKDLPPYCSLMRIDGTLNRTADCDTKAAFICIAPLDDGKPDEGGKEPEKEPVCKEGKPREGFPDYKSCKDVTGWVKVHPGPSDYDEAKDTCQKEGGEILDSNNPKFKELALKMLKHNSTDLKPLVIFGKNKTTDSSEGFHKVGGQTKFIGKPKEYCSVIYPNGTIDNKASCNSKLSFICYVPYPEEDACDGAKPREGHPDYRSCKDPEGWVKVHPDPTDYFDAKDKCKTEGGEIIDTNNPKYQELALKLMKQKRNGIESVFNRNVTVASGNGFSKVGGQTKFFRKDRNVCSILHSNGTLEEHVDCDSKQPFICFVPFPNKDDNGGNKSVCDGAKPRKGYPDYKSCKDNDGWVKVHPDPVDHDDAKEKCEAEGGSLLNHNDPKQLELALKLMKENETLLVVLGKTKKTFPGGGFKVVDGKNRFVKDLPPECTVIFANGTIDERGDCDKIMSFICYVPFPDKDDDDNVVPGKKEVCDNGKPRKDYPDYKSCKDGGGWVKVHPDPKDHDDAKETCENEGGSLLNLKDPKQLELALKLMKENETLVVVPGKTKKTFPGGGFKIINGQKRFVKDLPPECTVIFANGTVDETGDCNKTMSFICYVPFPDKDDDDNVVPGKKEVCDNGKPRKNYPDYKSCKDDGGWVKIHPEQEDHDDAKEKCENEGGALLNHNDPKQLELALKLMKENKTIVILGKTKRTYPDGGFKIIDGKKKYVKDLPPECTVVYSNGTIDDRADCDTKLTFICYVPFPDKDDDNVIPEKKKVCKDGKPREGHPDYKSCTEIEGWVKIHPETVDFDKAKDSCEKEGGQILDTNNPEHKKVALELMKENTVDGKPITIFGKNKTIQPNEGFNEVGGNTKFMRKEKEYCSVLYPNGTIDARAECNSELSFICYVPYPKDSCDGGPPRKNHPDYKSCKNITGWVKIHPEPTDYDDANDKCHGEGGAILDTSNPDFKKIALELIKKTGKPLTIFGQSKNSTAGQGFHKVGGETKFLGKNSKICTRLHLNGTTEENVSCGSKNSFICYVPFSKDDGTDEVKKEVCISGKPRTGYPDYKSCTDLTGWVKIHPGPNDYDEANATCHKEGGDILDVNNPKHLEVALELMKKNNDGKPIVIFGKNKTLYPDGGFNQKDGETKFGRKEKEFCSLLYPNGTIEHKADCKSKVSFICYVPFPGEKELEDSCDGGAPREGYPDYKSCKNVTGWVKIHPGPSDFDEAKDTCKKEGGVVLDPANPAHKQIAMELMEKSRLKTGKSVMIFAKNRTTVTGNGFTPVDGNTKFIGKKKSMCSLMYPNGTIVDNVDCNSKIGFICYVPYTVTELDCGTDGYRLEKSNGQCYKMYTMGKMFDESRKHCQSEGGDLAIIKSDKEAELLADIYQNHKEKYVVYNPMEIFVGFREKGTSGNRSWETIEGQDVSKSGYNKWSRIYEGKDPRCGCINMMAKYLPCDCDLSHGYICQKKATSKLVPKM